MPGKSKALATAIPVIGYMLQAHDWVHGQLGLMTSSVACMQAAELELGLLSFCGTSLVYMRSNQTCPRWQQSRVSCLCKPASQMHMAATAI